MAGIDERPEPDARERARLARGNVAIQMGDHALRQVVGLDAIGDRELLQARHQAPVPADDARDQAFVAPVIQAARLAIPLPGRIDERQITRLALQLRIGGLRLQEELLQRDGDTFREADAHEAARGNGIAAADKPHCILRRNDLAGVGRVRCAWRQLVPVHRSLLNRLISIYIQE